MMPAIILALKVEPTSDEQILLLYLEYYRLLLVILVEINLIIVSCNHTDDASYHTIIESRAN